MLCVSAFFLMYQAAQSYLTQTGLYCIQHRVGGGCRTKRSKDFSPLPPVEWYRQVVEMWSMKSLNVDCLGN